MDVQDFNMIIWSIFKMLLPLLPVLVFHKFADLRTFEPVNFWKIKIPGGVGTLLYAVGAYVVWENMGSTDKTVSVEIPYHTSDGFRIKNNKACISPSPKESHFFDGKKKLLLVFHVSAGNFNRYKNIIFKHYETVTVGLMDHIDNKKDHVSLFSIPRTRVFYKSDKVIKLKRKPPGSERENKFYDRDIPSTTKPGIYQ